MYATQTCVTQKYEVKVVRGDRWPWFRVIDTESGTVELGFMVRKNADDACRELNRAEASEAQAA
jgi:hypothetical protein